MSSSPNHPATHTAVGPRIITFLFTLSVVVFLLAGLAIVVGQAVILAGGDATGARDWQKALVPYAFGGASVAGLLAFVLTYWHGEDEDGLNEDDEEYHPQSDLKDTAADSAAPKGTTGS
jgi:hypothetical protein